MSSELRILSRQAHLKRSIAEPADARRRRAADNLKLRTNKREEALAKRRQNDAVTGEEEVAPSANTKVRFFQK